MTLLLLLEYRGKLAHYRTNSRVIRGGEQRLILQDESGFRAQGDVRFRRRP